MSTDCCHCLKRIYLTIKSRLTRRSSIGSSKYSEEAKYFNLEPLSKEESANESEINDVSNLDTSKYENECLLCYEVVDKINPPVLSLCGCGMNRHVYHYQCLLRWRTFSQQKNCPICDKEIFFQDKENVELVLS